MSKSDINSGRFLNWRTLTYPDDRERVEHLFSLVAYGYSNVCWAVHDMDTDKNGQLEKPHCHAVIHLPNSKTRSAFAQCFAIRERMVIPVTKGDDIESLDQALLYLIHADNRSRVAGKYQYPLSVIKGPWAAYARSRIQELLSSTKQKDESTSYLSILDFVDNSLYLSMTELSRWAASHGLWSVFRRSSSILRDVLREHNTELDRLQVRRDMETLEERLAERNQIEALYEAVGMRTLRALDGMLEQAGRPSLKLKSHIAYVDEVIHKSRGQVNVELIKSILRGDDYGTEEKKGAS